MWRRIPNHYAPTTYERRLSDADAGQNDSANPDLRQRLNHDTPTQRGGGRHMYMVAKAAVMLDDCTRIDNAVSADVGSSVNHRAGQDHRSFTEVRIQRNHGGRMH